MSDELIRWLEPQLKPGYTLQPGSGNAYRVLDPKGVVVRAPDSGQPVVIYAMNGWHYRKRTVGNLQEAGVIAKAKKKRTGTASSADHAKRPQVVNRKNPIITADEIMRDPKATPRERAMAREYTRVSEENTRVMALIETVRHREKMRQSVIIEYAKRLLPDDKRRDFMRDIQRILKD